MEETRNVRKRKHPNDYTLYIHTYIPEPVGPIRSTLLFSKSTLSSSSSVLDLPGSAPDLVAINNFSSAISLWMIIKMKRIHLFNNWLTLSVRRHDISFCNGYKQLLKGPANKMGNQFKGKDHVSNTIIKYTKQLTLYKVTIVCRVTDSKHAWKHIRKGKKLKPFWHAFDQWQTYPVPHKSP